MMKNNLRYIVTKLNGEIINSNAKDIHDTILNYVTSIDIPSSSTFLIKNLPLNDFKEARFKIIERGERVFTFFSNNETHIKSSSKFISEVDYFFSLFDSIEKEIKTIEEKHNSSLRMLSHNLTKYVAQSLQQVELLIPQHEIIKKNWKDKKRHAESIVERHPKETAEAILKLAKHAQGMKTEISIHSKLLSATPQLKIEKHNIHRVIMNSLYFFFPEFTDKNIEVLHYHSTAETKFDYESFSVALYHIFENATKYCKENSKLIISTQDLEKEFLIQFSMLSLQILHNERGLIFVDGHRGSKATQYSIPGNGVGMFVISEIMKMNKGRIDLKTMKDSFCVVNDIPYENNIIEVFLPKN